MRISKEIMSKQEPMDEVVAEIQHCQKCRLWDHAKNAVPGEGKLDASIMLIGAAIIYNPAYRQSLKEDFLKIRKEMKEYMDISRGCSHCCCNNGV